MSLGYLSQALQIEVYLHIHNDWLEAIWFIRGLESSVKVRIAKAMAPTIMAPGEISPPGNLYVISRGRVMYGGRILSRGSWWGDDIILSDSRWCIPFLARAIAYTDVTTISKEKLMEIVETHPVSVRCLRRSTALLALRRAIIFTARRHVQEASDGRESRLDFMDKVDVAAKGLVATDEEEKSMNIALELSRMSSANSPQKRSYSRGSVGEANSASDTARFEGLERVMAALEGVQTGMETLSQEVQAIRSGQQSLYEQLAELKPSGPNIIRGARLPTAPSRTAA